MSKIDKLVLLMFIIVVTTFIGLVIMGLRQTEGGPWWQLELVFDNTKLLTKTFVIIMHAAFAFMIAFMIYDDYKRD